jgi:hypothetical protein
MAHIETTTNHINPDRENWGSVSVERIDHSVPPPPANRHIVFDSSSTATIVETSNQFVKYGESRGIRNVNDRRRLLRLFDDFKGNSGADNRDEFSRVLFELSRNQKLFRVVGGVTIDWCDVGVGSSTKRTTSTGGQFRGMDLGRLGRIDTQDTRRNYEREHFRHERPRDNEDPRDRRISELMRTIQSMEQTMERMQYRLDSVCNDRGKY